MNASDAPVRLILRSSSDDPRSRAIAVILLIALGTFAALIGAATTRDGESVVWGGLLIGVGTVAFIFAVSWLMIRSAARDPGSISVGPDEITVEVPKTLSEPFRIPTKMIRSIAVDDGREKWTAFGNARRFPIVGGAATAVGRGSAPPQWFYSWRGKSARLPIVNREPLVPNVAILFVQPLPAPRARRWGQASLMRTPLIRLAGPTQLRGLYAAVKDPERARSAFHDLGLLAPIGTADVARLQPTAEQRRRARLIMSILVAGLVLAVALQVVLFLRPSGACAAADRLLPSRSETPRSSVSGRPAATPDLSLLLMDGQPAGLRTFSQALDLPAAAATWWADPDEGVRTLTRYGFVQGFMRGWNGGQTFATVFEFSSDENALAFQAHATHSACRSSSEAFAVPGVDGAVGLRIRFRAGHIDDQVSTVRGSRRYLVGQRYVGEPPGDHALVIVLAQAQDAGAR